MPNMSYCRMENTYEDLCDCYANWNEADSASELEYRAKILSIAQDIVSNFGDEDMSLWSDRLWNVE